MTTMYGRGYPVGGGSFYDHDEQYYRDSQPGKAFGDRSPMPSYEDIAELTNTIFDLKATIREQDEKIRQLSGRPRPTARGPRLEDWTPLDRAGGLLDEVRALRDENERLQREANPTRATQAELMAALARQADLNARLQGLLREQNDLPTRQEMIAGALLLIGDALNEVVARADAPRPGDAQLLRQLENDWALNQEMLYNLRERLPVLYREEAALRLDVQQADAVVQRIQQELAFNQRTRDSLDAEVADLRERAEEAEFQLRRAAQERDAEIARFQEEVDELLEQNRRQQDDAARRAQAARTAQERAAAAAEQERLRFEEERTQEQARLAALERELEQARQRTESANAAERRAARAEAQRAAEILRDERRQRDAEEDAEPAPNTYVVGPDRPTVDEVSRAIRAALQRYADRLNYDGAAYNQARAVVRNEQGGTPERQARAEAARAMVDRYQARQRIIDELREQMRVVAAGGDWVDPSIAEEEERRRQQQAADAERREQERLRQAEEQAAEVARQEEERLRQEEEQAAEAARQEDAPQETDEERQARAEQETAAARRAIEDQLERLEADRAAALARQDAITEAQAQLLAEEEAYARKTTDRARAITQRKINTAEERLEEARQAAENDDTAAGFRRRRRELQRQLLEVGSEIEGIEMEIASMQRVSKIQAQISEKAAADANGWGSWF